MCSSWLVERTSDSLLLGARGAERKRTPAISIWRPPSYQYAGCNYLGCAGTIRGLGLRRRWQMLLRLHSCIHGLGVAPVDRINGHTIPFARVATWCYDGWRDQTLTARPPCLCDTYPRGDWRRTTTSRWVATWQQRGNRYAHGQYTANCVRRCGLPDGDGDGVTIGVAMGRSGGHDGRRIDVGGISIRPPRGGREPESPHSHTGPLGRAL